jgi:hypothetical protein
VDENRKQDQKQALHERISSFEPEL